MLIPNAAAASVLVTPGRAFSHGTRLSSRASWSAARAGHGAGHRDGAPRRPRRSRSMTASRSVGRLDDDHGRAVRARSRSDERLAVVGGQGHAVQVGCRLRAHLRGAPAQPVARARRARAARRCDGGPGGGEGVHPRREVDRRPARRRTRGRRAGVTAPTIRESRKTRGRLPVAVVSRRRTSDRAGETTPHGCRCRATAAARRAGSR